MLDRVKIAEQRGWSVKEIYKARDSWRKMNHRQPESDISFDEYLDMIQEAGLRPDKIGLRTGQYQLARFFDSGAYTKGNCRFVPQEVNQREREEGYQRDPKFRALISELAKHRKRLKCEYCGGAFTPGMYSRWHGEKCKFATRGNYAN